MKKAILIVIAVVVIFLALMFRGQRAVLDQMPEEDLIVFSQEKCPHCHHALAFINEQVRPNYPNLNIQVLDINKDPDNYTKLFMAAKKYNLDTRHLGTPVITYRGHALMGWSDKQANELMSYLKK